MNWHWLITAFKKTEVDGAAFNLLKSKLKRVLDYFYENESVEIAAGAEPAGCSA
jgi:hypothetical protein